VLAELLMAAGAQVTLVTPATRVAEWSVNTLEQGAIQARLLRLGVRVVVANGLAAVGAAAVELACIYTGRKSTLACDGVVMVTARLPEDQLHIDLKARQAEWADCAIAAVKVIGDAEAPAAIAWATYAGQRYAEELDEPERFDALPFRREIAALRN
jgi:dimethylamine/trimethylamine dehydrogenase